ncbi:hypothetical protein VTL71DRAFT_11352 [Oculimacula yallundae]|uniref:DUF6594 domain-containing protein n=1 Tax=Oculimacula yallundae TaxID=86028 RepID=A0ABR4CPZ7_9HELO
MTTKYTIPSVESILEDSEDESSEELSTKGDSADEKHPKPRPVYDTAMKANMGRERERERDTDKSRRHRSRKHTSKGKSKNSGLKRASGSSREEYEESQLRHRNRHANRHSSSASSEEEDGPEDHKAVLAAARSRLTSPSMVSNFTTRTTATNKSSSSSGSNSTVTQASIKRSSLGKKPEVEEAGEPPMSPAVPDPPNVFQFLDEGLQDKEESEEEGEDRQEEVNDEEGEESEESDQEQTAQWSTTRMKTQYIEAPPTSHIQHASTSSSASSSFHGDDNASEPAVDVDTDRSSSPERSVDGHDEGPTPPPADSVSVKIASQIAAAQQRQNVHGSMQQFGTPNMPRGNLYLPHVPSSALSSRSYHVQQRPLPRAEKLPVTGYELLASRLSTRPDTANEGRIKPVYRKFEALNHRLLLHLQDELSELEEQLHRLDHADTQSRRTDHPSYIIPASRRLAAQAGGELQWHKTDILGKIGYKLNQYNQALSSFNSTQSLHHPDLEDIEHYRNYLQNEQPIAEAETHFLDPTDDLVSIYSESHAPPSFLSSQAPSSSISSSSEVSSHTSHSTSSTPSPALPTEPSHETDLQPILPHLASAIAIAILVPILTFSVIPGFVGRLTVACLVAVFMVAAMVQSGIVKRSALLGQESCVCAGIYGGVMIVLAGIVA